MDDSYETITTAAIEAIEAMATDPRDTVICEAGSLLSLAANIYWSWTNTVGDKAMLADSDRMLRAICVLQEKRKARALAIAAAIKWPRADLLSASSMTLLRYRRLQRRRTIC